MKKRLLSVILGLSILGGLAVSMPGQVKRNLEMEAKLLEKLASTKQAEADSAAKEVLRLGEKMIPALLQKRGDTALFFGTFGLAPDTMFIHRPTNDASRDRILLQDGKLVTIEVASLFLINAIYFEDMNFSQTPYLVDFSLPSEQQKAANKKFLVEKAWNAVEAWSQKLNSEGIKKLRETKTSPFEDADLSFY